MEDFRWYKSLVLFGCGDDPYDINSEDTDVKLIPTVLENSMIPKLTGMYSKCYPIHAFDAKCDSMLIIH